VYSQARQRRLGLRGRIDMSRVIAEQARPRSREARKAAIDDEDVAGHVARVVAREKQKRSGDILGFDRIPHGRHFGRALARDLQFDAAHIGYHRRRHAARGNSVYPDAA